MVKSTVGGSKKASRVQTSPNDHAPTQAQVRNAHPLDIALDSIDEDPNQPRTVFDPQLISELADTIRQRGVKNPISVHHHPEKPGRYIINDGARRYRASLLAGKKTIKAFIDADFTKIDQIIVNAHQAGFTPREWAILIDQEEKKGKSRRQIARELGMSAPHITSHAALLRLPDAIAEIFNSGRCQDVTAVNHLVVVWRQYPDDVEFWLEDPSVEITRASIAKLRAFLDSRAQSELPGEPAVVAKERKTRIPSPLKLHKPILRIRYEGKPAQLLFNRRPAQPGYAWIRFDDGSEMEGTIENMQLTELSEGK